MANDNYSKQDLLKTIGWQSVTLAPIISGFVIAASSTNKKEAVLGLSLIGAGDLVILGKLYYSLPNENEIKK
jgi:hypothetical protein